MAAILPSALKTAPCILHKMGNNTSYHHVFTAQEQNTSFEFTISSPQADPYFCPYLQSRLYRCPFSSNLPPSIALPVAVPLAR